MFESGAFVAEHVEPLAESQVQPNGVDLTLDTVFEQVSPGRISTGGKEIGERREKTVGGADVVVGRPAEAFTFVRVDVRSTSTPSTPRPTVPGARPDH